VRAAGVDRVGGPVRLLELPAPRPLRDDEVLIQVHAAGVGNWDEIVRTGGWATGAQPPYALGVAAAGTVIAAGAAVTGLAAGTGGLTHPLPLRQGGTWAEQLIAPAALVARKPAGVPWPAAAALPVPGLTALQTLDGSLRLSAGQTVLVNGAGGLTGGLLVQLAALRGARVIATAGPASASRVRGLGAGLVLDYHQPDWPDEVTAAASALPAAVNAAPGAAARLLPLVEDGGRLATLTSDPPDPERGVHVESVYVRADGASSATWPSCWTGAPSGSPCGPATRWPRRPRRWPRRAAARAGPRSCWRPDRPTARAGPRSCWRPDRPTARWRPRSSASSACPAAGATCWTCCSAAGSSA
jgi:NADPH:quinone reductase-like Zn-dependent oxidoreductase